MAQNPVSHNDLANTIRALSMDAVEAAQSGHPGMPMGMADVATVLFTKFLKFDVSNPDWADRDRFILSAGHGSMLMYSLLHLSGYEDMTMDDLKNFRQLHAKTAGHPEYGYAKGVETTTGPLGQGVANAVGFALAERIMNARHGDDLVNHNTYVIAGDGCLSEGICQEAIVMASHLGLSKLTLLWDDNEITIDGHTSLATSENQVARFEAAGWDVQAIDGHDPKAIEAAIEAAQKTDKPSMIACKTTIGFGAPTKAGKASSHGAPLGADEIAGAKKNLGWDHGPFEVPTEIIEEWRKAGVKNRAELDAWNANLNGLGADKKDEFLRQLSNELPEGWRETLTDLKKKFFDDGKALATRKASGEVLEVIKPLIPEIVGGSADLSGSNNTITSKSKAISKEDYDGNYMHYGVREHAMAAMMNGMSLHGGVLPYGATFLVFTDYCKPSIRLSALMEQRVIYVMTHDSIGLGEDGPTHQPIEHLASLRAVPNLLVFRPADAIETAECWELALMAKSAPSVLVLSRQGLPIARDHHSEENLSTLGAYVLSPSKGARDVTLIATGSEVAIAMEAQKMLHEKGVGAAVVSVPCWKLFNEQGPEYQELVLQHDSYKVVIEAAFPMGWRGYIGERGTVVGMTSFGASGPAKDLYKEFGITAENVVEKALQGLTQ